MQTCPISINTHCGVINREISCDTKSHCHFVKQVKFYLIPNKEFEVLEMKIEIEFSEKSIEKKYV